jgi:phage baseplate assembly protein W
MSSTPNAWDLVGVGWAYPTGLTATGSVLLAGGTAELVGAIRFILQTRVGERVMRPEFGCRIWDYLFEPITPRTLGLVEQAAREALARWEPRIDLTGLTAEPGAGEGEILLVIDYQVRATNDYRNLVFPFYTIPREVAP